MTDPIHPPPYVPTEQEHKLAYMKWMLERIVWDELLGIDMLRGDLLKKTVKPTVKQRLGLDPQEWEKRLQSLLDRLFRPEKEHAPDADAWENLLRFEDFKAESTKDLAGYHCGDCVAVACACIRCHLEDLYEIPSTVTWNGKHEGWYLYREFRLEEEAKLVLNKDTHIVDVEKWKTARWPMDLIDPALFPTKARDAYYALELEWNLRTSGAGSMHWTVLYALRAHMRGRVHCHDHDYQAQREFLKKALPFIHHLLKPRETSKEGYLRVTEKMLEARAQGDEEREDRLADVLDGLWWKMSAEERKEVDQTIKAA
jgi:hypothetical protein